MRRPKEGAFAVWRLVARAPFAQAGLLALFTQPGLGAQTSSHVLEIGQVVQSTLAAGATDAYMVKAGPRSFIRLEIEHGGTRLRLTPDPGDHAASGSAADVRERTAGDRQSIVWSGVTDREVVAVRLTSLEAAVARGYTITLLERRPATPTDLAIIEAERLLERGGDVDRLTDARRALDLGDAAKDADLQMRALLLIGRLHADAGRVAESERALATASERCRQARRPACEAAAELRLGRLLGAAGQPERMRERTEIARAISERIGDLAGQSEALVELAGLDVAQTRQDDARHRLERALYLARTAGDRRSEGDALNVLGILHSNVGDADASEASYQAALAVRRSIADEAGVAQTTSNLGALANSLGEARRATAYLDEALAARRRLGNLQAIANTLHNLGVAHANIGELEIAIGYFEEALGAWQKSGGRRGEAFALQEMGQSYARLGDRRRALEHLERGRPIWKEVGDRRGEAQTMLFTAAILADASDLRRAGDAYRAALELARAGSLRREAGLALLGSAGVARREGDAHRAVAQAREALGVFTAISNRREIGRAHAEIGAAHLAAEQWTEAHAALREGLTALEAVEDRAEQGKVGIALAEARERVGDADGAVAALLDALDRLESVRRDQHADSLNLSIFASDRPYYDRAIATLMRLHGRAPSAKFDERAFEVSERRRARRLLDMVTGGEARLEEGASTIELRHTEERIASKAARLTRLLSDTAAPSGTRVETARRELADLVERADRLRAELRRRHQTAVSHPKLLTAAEVRQRLDDRSVLLEYALGEAQSYGWALTRTALVAFELPSRIELERRIERVVRAASGASQSPADFQAGVRPLAQVLLGPVAEQLTGKTHVLVVGDGKLDAMPFGALPSPGSRVPLASRVQIRMVPSASVDAALDARRLARTQAADRIAVFADPVYSPGDGRVPLASRRRDASGGEVPLRLRFSREEARAIQELAPRRSTVWTDFAATRTRALDGTLGRYRYLHFASHAVVDESLPQLSTIQLSRVDEAGRFQNGALRLRDLLSLTLNAELVVLSACRTALGAQVAGEGLIGFAGGFLRAGADRVLASLWDVDDRAAATFMSRFYEGLFQRRLAPERAYHEAQTSMRLDPRWRHPRDWAGWVLIGASPPPADPRALEPRASR